ncbi:hypothetical protein [Phytopseudomonas dryadis]|uniref:Uncharacterized protein n=1 Tax=Phytopseudomonas dryadis TaxID=2487520 RepID=A0A4Q9RAQ8_9GAMM|nr:MULTISPECIES: hypothetical protein [Pseudomonas]TBU97667.1 hypothetical protein DNK44_01395 [Pseudomonas dryadis]TBV10121.1 hypothetical protein DNK34_01405 [Pseudomonas dryadis]TBV19047.1 hypothetical protein DNK41_04840 [Pseudomonas sp. FRB 230]
MNARTATWNDSRNQADTTQLAIAVPLLLVASLLAGFAQPGALPLALSMIGGAAAYVLIRAASQTP